MIWSKRLLLFSVISLTLVLAGCGICGSYNLSGSNLPTDIKTISVAFFNNEAELVNPQLSLAFTEKLKTKFQSESKLKLVTENGDYKLSGAIRNYRWTPATLSGPSGGGQNQFTISVHVNFESEKHPEKNFSKDFSQNAVFDASQNFSDVEQQYASDISDKIVQQIFAEIALDW